MTKVVALTTNVSTLAIRCNELGRQFLEQSDVNAEAAFMNLCGLNTLPALQAAQERFEASNNSDVRLMSLCNELFKELFQPMLDLQAELAGSIEGVQAVFSSGS